MKRRDSYRKLSKGVKVSYTLPEHQKKDFLMLIQQHILFLLKDFRRVLQHLIPNFKVLFLLKGFFKGKDCFITHVIPKYAQKDDMVIQLGFMYIGRGQILQVFCRQQSNRFCFMSLPSKLRIVNFEQRSTQMDSNKVGIQFHSSEIGA